MAAKPVYWYSLTRLDFKGVVPLGQLQCHVAADTLKRAAELFDVRPDEIRQYGGTSYNDAINALCRTEPETVFVQAAHGEFFRLGDDPTDPEKRILIDMRDQDTHGVRTQHPSYGMMNVSRIYGQAALFQVDYPQDHYIELTIHTATRNRRSGADTVFEDRIVAKVAMSEVQWARMISSPNTTGVPVTLRHYHDPLTGDFLSPHLPADHTQNVESFRAAVQRKADLAVENITAAEKRLGEIMKGGAIRKGDIAEVLDLLQTATREARANLPYVVEHAAEEIEKAAENAKTEIGAFHDFAMLKLGERAFGDRIQQALETGADMRGAGQLVIEALTKKDEA